MLALPHGDVLAGGTGSVAGEIVVRAPQDLSLEGGLKVSFEKRVDDRIDDGAQVTNDRKYLRRLAQSIVTNPTERHHVYEHRHHEPRQPTDRVYGSHGGEDDQALAVPSGLLFVVLFLQAFALVDGETAGQRDGLEHHAVGENHEREGQQEHSHDAEDAVHELENLPGLRINGLAVEEELGKRNGRGNEPDRGQKPPGSFLSKRAMLQRPSYCREPLGRDGKDLVGCQHR